MRITKKLILLWLILFLPFLAFKLWQTYRADQAYQRSYTAHAPFVGQQFDIPEAFDSSGKKIALIHQKTPITIIDFWFAECPPCIAEMKQFPALLEKAGSKVKIVSVSVNGFSRWMEVLKSPGKTFDFLKARSSNWQQAVLTKEDDPALGNSISGESLQLLREKYASGSFPMYFVLNPDGRIIATPFSAVAYLRTEVIGESKASFMMTDSRLRQVLIDAIPGALIEYSGFFWIGILLMTVVNRMRKKSSAG